jgi:hypothetical protein
LALASSNPSRLPARMRWPVLEMGKKLGQSLHHTHDGGLDQQHNVHVQHASD